MKPAGGCVEKRGAFLDTNVLVYAFSDDPRAAQAEALLASGCATAVQALNEFTNVARRKLGFGWDEVEDALRSIRTLCSTVVPLDIGVHEDGLRIARQHRLSLFDALMVAAALGSGCDTLWSEDMHDGLVIDGRLRVRNPFVEA